MTGYESKRAAAQDKLAQKPVAHCEAGPEYCVQCKLEDRSIVLAAAVRYVKNNTPPLVSDEICMALATPPQRPWVGLEGEEIRYLWEEATKPDRSTMTMVTSFAKDIETKLKEKNNAA